MVGPRSTGCRRCVTRRIKCDEHRPSCHACNRLGFICPGYTRKLTFIAEAPASNGILTSSRAKFAGASTAKRKTHGDLQTVSFNMPGLYHSAINKAPSAFTDDARCAFFLDKYFALGNWNEDHQYNKSWIWQSLQSPSKYPISHLACRSLILAFFTNTHHDPSLHHEVLRTYTESLQALKDALTGQVTWDLLSAVALLCLFEACFYTSLEAWMQHSAALRKIVQLQGPDYFRQRPQRSLLMLFRHHLINDSIITRKRSFLENPGWDHILVSEDNEASLTLKLGDLVLHMGGISEDIEALPSQNTQNLSTCYQSLLDRLIDMLDSLRAWWNEWSSDPGRLPVRTIALAQQGMRPAPPMPDSNESTMLRFVNLEAAAGFCRYHAHVLLALHWLDRLSNVATELSLCKPRQTTYRSSNNSTAHALVICEALLFYCLPHYRYIGAVYIGLPARVAWQELEPDSEHALWIGELMDYLADTGGFTISKGILRGMGSPAAHRM